MSRIKDELLRKIEAGEIKPLLRPIIPDYLIPPKIFGEVKDDGSMRGYGDTESVEKYVHSVRLHDYVMWNVDEETIGILYRPSGEMGMFKKADFENYVSAFFGLNF